MFAHVVSRTSTPTLRTAIYRIDRLPEAVRCRKFFVAVRREIRDELWRRAIEGRLAESRLADRAYRDEYSRAAARRMVPAERRPN